VTRATHAAVTFIAPGARTNPFPLGQPVKLEGWTVKVNSAILNANSEVAAVRDEFGRPENSPPRAGAQYTLVNVSLTFVGGGSSNLRDYLFDHELDAEGVHNAPYRSTGCVPPPPDPNLVGDVFSGQTVVGDLCYQIASNDADSLMLTAFEESENGRIVWFALR
jgi:hypothetical protein